MCCIFQLMKGTFENSERGRGVLSKWGNCNWLFDTSARIGSLLWFKEWKNVSQMLHSHGKYVFPGKRTKKLQFFFSFFSQTLIKRCFCYDVKYVTGYSFFTVFWRQLIYDNTFRKINCSFKFLGFFIRYNNSSYNSLEKST